MAYSEHHIAPFLPHLTDKLRQIAEKILASQRITEADAHTLYTEADLALLSALSVFVKKQKSGDLVYFNRNLHFEPTNICIFNCQFCSYARKPGQDGAWNYSLDEMDAVLAPYKNGKITELHIVSGVQKDITLEFFTNLIRRAKAALPGVTIKAFTAVELDYVFRKAGVSATQGLQQLKDAGLETLPGGGAEIFDHNIRQQICPDKCNAHRWLEIHQAAHQLGLPSNATILYGHYETYTHRVDHMARLRQLQDTTKGFNAFIPLKFRSANNPMQPLGEVPLTEDLRNFAVARIFLDNFDHIKAYWPMLGKANLSLTLSFGVDDLDGTIDDSTKIYTMAGVDDDSVKMSPQTMQQLVASAGYQSVERDSFYRPLG